MTDLSARYGSAPAWRRPLGLAVVAAVAAVFLAWLAWAAYDASTPEVQSKLAGFEVVSDTEVSAVLTVALSADAEGVVCRLQAQGRDHEVVGEHSFTPTEGVNRVAFRTQRRAVSVDSLGCTADGQKRPR